MHKLNLLQVAVILACSMIANALATAAKPKNLTQRVANEIVAFDYHDIPPEVIEKAEQLIRWHARSALTRIQRSSPWNRSLNRVAATA